MSILSDDERDVLLLALVEEAQRNHRPFGHDAPACIVCGQLRMRPHAERCPVGRTQQGRLALARAARGEDDDAVP